jgi:hypothetical protein
MGAAACLTEAMAIGIRVMEIQVTVDTTRILAAHPPPRIQFVECPSTQMTGTAGCIMGESIGFVRGTALIDSKAIPAITRSKTGLQVRR